MIFSSSTNLGMESDGMNTTRSFAALNKDEGIRGISSSGGVFYAIAEKILLDGGIVFGAAFDGEWQVHHESCSSIQDLHRLLQSKYVQSSLKSSFHDVRDALMNGKMTLFCGTPCQVEGLLSYLGQTIKKDGWRESLLTIDFICHGVPSRMVWRRYLKEISGNRAIQGINFRDKSRGWRDFHLRVDYADGKSYIKSQHSDPYMRGFLSNLYLRESCYECQFRGVDRISDFSLADFWGVHKIMPDFFDDKGTSIVMAHNDRAVTLLAGLSDKLSLREIENETVIQTNSSVVRSVNRNKNRDAFFQSVDSDRISARIMHHLRQPLIKRIKRKVKTMLHL